MSNQALLSAWQRRWHRSLLRFLASRARHVDIADLAQETYLRLLRAPDLREVRNPEAYLIRVASHVAAEWTFSARTLEKLTASMNAALVEENTPELEVQATLSQQRVEQLFKELPAAVKAALVLRLREGQTGIAQERGVDLPQHRGPDLAGVVDLGVLRAARSEQDKDGSVWRERREEAAAGDRPA